MIDSELTSELSERSFPNAGKGRKEWEGMQITETFSKTPPKPPNEDDVRTMKDPNNGPSYIGLLALRLPILMGQFPANDLLSWAYLRIRLLSLS